MVFLSRKKPPPPPSSSSAAPSLKIPQPQKESVEPDAVEKMTAILAEVGCTLMNPYGPPCLPSDLHAFRRNLTGRLSSFSANSGERDNVGALCSVFVAGFSLYIQSPSNLRRMLSSSSTTKRDESLVRNLLLVSPIQLDIQEMLLEKLPEYFDVVTGCSLEEDVARLIINHFRWLDFIVNPHVFTDKLMQVLSICPLHLKKEIIGSLPEIIGDHNCQAVVDSLEKMLQEDSAVVVAVLDSFSNLNLDDQLQEQAITVAISCIRTIDGEHMPYLLRFLLLAATPVNVRRIISQIREQLKFTGMSQPCASQNKLKGKVPAYNAEGSILHALRSSLRFKNILCQEIIKELNSLEKPRDFKVIDVWLLILMYMNGDPVRKSIEKIFKKKVVDECIQEALLDQCIGGNKEFVKDNFASFVSLAEHLLSSKEEKAREIGSHIYSRLFEEFTDNYSRQEILGALVTHVGSDNKFEVSSVLEMMTALVKKYAQQLLPFSSHINGILDYLEGFTIDNLHKVYEVFSLLALSARASGDSFRSSISNELMMIVRKQVSHPDLKYKKMGLVGSLRIVSSLGDAKSVPDFSSSQVSDCGEILELLKTSVESCRQSNLALIMFYDEFATILSHKLLQPEIMEWIGKHLGEFESLFLADLENEKMAEKGSYSGLEGDLWMNLDGSISPICLNILALASSSSESCCLQILPSNFLLLSTVERLTNDGSLAGVDALLGCPLHLPSSKYFAAAGWQSLAKKQKEILSLSLYYAANWIRELLNAFSSQIDEKIGCISQATVKDVTTKLLKRLRNLVFLESLLSNLITLSPQSLPELHPYSESHVEHPRKKNEKRKLDDDASQRKVSMKNNLKKSKHSDVNEKLRQPTIMDAFKKAGAVMSHSQTQLRGTPSLPSMDGSTAAGSMDENCSDNESLIVKIPQVSSALEAQRFKFRPLLPQCLSILNFPKVLSQDMGSPEYRAELPLYLYLLHDLHTKLDCLVPPGKQHPFKRGSAPGYFGRFKLVELLNQIKRLFPSLRIHLNIAISLLIRGDETSQTTWRDEFALSGNPNTSSIVVSESLVYTMVCKEVLYCFSKILTLPEFETDKSLLLNLLEAFQPTEIPVANFPDFQPFPSPGTKEYLYIGVSYFFEDILNKACSFSFDLAFECLLTLQLVVTSVQKYLGKVSEEANRKRNPGHFHGLVPNLHAKLGTSAEKLLRHKWVDESTDNKGLKNKGEMVQTILRIYLEASGSTSDLLDELACTILPQASLSKSTGEDDDARDHEFPTLCAATFRGWYKTLLEENLAILNKLVKTVSSEKRQNCQPKTTEAHLKNIQKTVNVVVSLVNLCRSHEKVTIHGMAIKYGGKYVDSFLKVFDFLEAHFQDHKELVIQLVKDLQKATRTLQTLCSEAKGMKQTAITSKIPATKRSLERFLFHVKALLHRTSGGSNFWMGSLKHKDLRGQIVSSQAYIDNEADEVEETMSGEEEPMQEDELPLTP
ncbi:fanconi anemia group D2 protein [Arabidopsis thaliana]|uniref:FANCD2 n=1 Tax=Arabidopsis thaliana TaxID=3702 RepID=A0A1P8B4W8_ARATH|nr:fanconi anemia group D2 protein [Arabidopsis thaliana]ANM66639.1 fanconi anemia group D2 protein [Arabidopsis thaliana]AVZ66246.1 FANCD2 [Arabidopsis thaliana]|eukprot:NP_001328523.1 fanconi anemia group D2 protein [Arabidopsis thaliana]